jgi:hypothetical protein
MPLTIGSGITVTVFGIYRIYTFTGSGTITI